MARLRCMPLLEKAASLRGEARVARPGKRKRVLGQSVDLTTCFEELALYDSMRFRPTSLQLGTQMRKGLETWFLQRSIGNPDLGLYVAIIPLQCLQCLCSGCMWPSSLLCLVGDPRLVLLGSHLLARVSSILGIFCLALPSDFSTPHLRLSTTPAQPAS